MTTLNCRRRWVLLEALACYHNPCPGSPTRIACASSIVPLSSIALLTRCPTNTFNERTMTALRGNVNIRLAIRRREAVVLLLLVMSCFTRPFTVYSTVNTSKAIDGMNDLQRDSRNNPETVSTTTNQDRIPSDDLGQRSVTNTTKGKNTNTWVRLLAYAIRGVVCVCLVALEKDNETSEFDLTVTALINLSSAGSTAI